ncbi:hypothetical protein J7T55_005374 [Diaporthe amygdali]|uniref:uncharacterized protein n=1 Tax=Phomopsis amygdali TaxID=1214568 RepID=UPI0022FDD9FD|nr:uncharacterized protein J7T55_005374 [Diaporthe amygdali]KAJ0108397.1 hypothetical protein J7T55_005374 [Diaporthe amygdali]
MSFPNLNWIMSELSPKSICPQADRLAEAGLAHRVLLPTDTDYVSRNESYWSKDARLRPACIVTPRSADEVSKAVVALVAGGHTFAIRSGGHASWANNIDRGVTIDLGLMTDLTVDTVSETVRFGPGGRWRDIYAVLAPYDRIVPGGREGQVGVAGLLLGGGKTFLTARRGFACDNVLEYEVVLADGRIVKANKDEHPDLFRALKGGSSNFGIVTSFKMAMVENKGIWGGITVFSKEHIPAAIEATRDFAANVAAHPDENLIVLFTKLPSFKETVICTLYVSMTGTERAPAYSKWLALPEITTNTKMTTVAELIAENNTPGNYHVIWFTLTFKNNTRIMAKASELHDTLVEELESIVPDGNMVSQCIFQPLPKLYGEKSAEAGGNMLGLEKQKDDAVLLLALVSVPTAEQRAIAYPKVKAWVDEVQKFATSIDGAEDWLYLNYANSSQDVLASYGAENVEFMKKVAAKYDPEQVFQKLCPGGFKVSEL